mmetsp:Transcript_42471/g.76523  ORF Transcript_42471/g.76523 Transcript_42471/m.76523 type:complete len:418 (-) Transcript_42471:1657-2910(-)
MSGRFVPHSYAASASSVAEQHFTASKQVEKEEAGVNTLAASNTTKYSTKEPALGANDEHSGIAGVTICFTTELSPSSPPSDLHIEGTGCGVHVASSLDDRSTTEYEVLDGISSKGSVEIGDLILEDDGKECIGLDGHTDKASIKKHEGKNEWIHSEVGGDMAAPLANSSPNLSSLNSSIQGNIPSLFKQITTETFSQSDETKTPRVPNKGPPKAVSNSEPRKLDLDTKDITDDKEPKDDHSDPNSPLKVDERSLTPFENLHKFWERKSTFTRMIKGGVKRILGKITPKGVDLDAVPNKSVDASEGILESAAATINLIKGSTYVTKCKHALSGLSAIKVCYAIASCTLIYTVLLMFQLKIRNAQLEIDNVSLRTALHNQPKPPKLRPDVSVGVPPTAFREHQFINVNFHGFSSFDSTK